MPISIKPKEIKSVSINLFRLTLICTEIENSDGSPMILIDPTFDLLELDQEDKDFWEAEQRNLNKGIEKRIALAVLSDYCGEDFDRYAESEVVYMGKTYRFRIWELE
jgi:hypothetical protein